MSCFDGAVGGDVVEEMTGAGVVVGVGTGVGIGAIILISGSVAEPPGQLRPGVVDPPPQEQPVQYKYIFETKIPKKVVSEILNNYSCQLNKKSFI